MRLSTSALSIGFDAASPDPAVLNTDRVERGVWSELGVWS